MATHSVSLICVFFDEEYVGFARLGIDGHNWSCIPEITVRIRIERSRQVIGIAAHLYGIRTTVELGTITINPAIRGGDVLADNGIGLAVVGTG